MPDACHIKRSSFGSHDRFEVFNAEIQECADGEALIDNQHQSIDGRERASLLNRTVGLKQCDPLEKSRVDTGGKPSSDFPHPVRE
jgi:NADPH-dependent curcumin reductase CurA